MGLEVGEMITWGDPAESGSFDEWLLIREALIGYYNNLTASQRI
jgi:hypothetical protein